VSAIGLSLSQLLSTFHDAVVVVAAAAAAAVVVVTILSVVVASIHSVISVVVVDL